MLKRIGLRRITMTTMALVVLGLIYIFPSKEENVKLTNQINYIENLETVYLIDKNDYVSQIKVNIDNEKLEQKLIDSLEYLIINGKKYDEVPNGFKPIIPEDTVILDLTIDNDICNVNFSKNILNISKELEEKMIEAIVYTLTSSKEINKVSIMVEGIIMKELPNSKIKLPDILDRKFGINKIYDIDNLYGLTQTTIYFMGKNGEDIYYVPVTKINNDDNEKISIIVDELKSSLTYQTNLNSYLNNSVELENYEIVEDTMYLTFNDKIFDSIYDDNILEEVKYTISMSVKDNYDVENVVFKVENKEITKSVLKDLE